MARSRTITAAYSNNHSTMLRQLSTGKAYNPKLAAVSNPNVGTRRTGCDLGARRRHPYAIAAVVFNCPQRRNQAARAS